ncbi:hypothetical protein Tco_1217808 [Tanacetum coccineum]
MNQNYSELNPCYDSNSYGFDQPPQYSIDHQPQNIQEDQQWISDKLIESNNKILEMIRSMFEEFRERQQAANLSTYTTEPSRCFNSFYDDVDYEESTIPLNEIFYQIPPDEFIKSSVEDLVPIPSVFEDTSWSDSDCNLPSRDDFSPINLSEDKSVIFSNPLFDSNDDFTSSDDESLSDDDVPEENFKIYSNPLFEFDDEYISSDVNPLFDEVFKDIENKDSYVSNLDESALLVTPLSDVNEDECFDPGGDIDKIDDFLDMDVPTDIKDGFHDSEGDIIYLESLLNDDTIPNLPSEVFLDYDQRSLKDDPDNLMTEDKDSLRSRRPVLVFNPPIIRSSIFCLFWNLQS